MQIETINVFFFTLAFLVPGFIVHVVLSVFVPLREKSEHISFLSFLTLSMVNYAFCSWLVYLVLFSGFFVGHSVRSAAAWFIMILASPVVLGIVFGGLSQKEIVRRLLLRAGFAPIHIIPTSWDYKFSRITEPLWVLITLKDGSQVAGLFGSKSFASSDPKERDLYVQKIWKIDDEGTWQPVDQDDGILISNDQIRHIEFRKDD